jgi:hypothetical protein
MHNSIHISHVLRDLDLTHRSRLHPTPFFLPNINPHQFNTGANIASKPAEKVGEDIRVQLFVGGGNIAGDFGRRCRGYGEVVEEC